MASRSFGANGRVQLHQGKTKVWNKSGRPPEDVRTLGSDAWQPTGIRVLGTPIGTAQFVVEAMEARIAEERCLWEAITFSTRSPVLGRFWSRAPTHERTTHCALCLRTPRNSAAAVFHMPASCASAQPAHSLGHTCGARTCQSGRHPPNENGLFGLEAQRCSMQASWASWADALPMIGERNPEIAAMALRSVEGEPPQQGCLADLQQATFRLDRERFWWRPTWQALLGGGEHPWRASVVDTHFKKRSILSFRAAAGQAHLHSHSGANANAASAHAPTAPEHTIPPYLFRVLLLERLQLPLPVSEAKCNGCHAPLDVLGRHKASCTVLGRIGKRATPIERTVARICREARARVRFNAFLKDMNINVGAADERRIVVFAQDLPSFGVRSWRWTSHCTVSCPPQESLTPTLPKWTVLFFSRRDKTKKKHARS